MRDKTKIDKLEAFDETKYEGVDLDHLIMYVMGRLEDMGVDLSFENAVVSAVKIFPKKFSLPGFSEYPDSNRVEQCLWRCTRKDKQWLGGKARQGFIITERSKRVIQETEKLLTGINVKKKKAPSRTRRKESLLVEVASAPAYVKYREGKKETIVKTDLYYLLQCTLDSSPQVLGENLKSLKKIAEDLDDKVILKFLGWLEEKFKRDLG